MTDLSSMTYRLDVWEEDKYLYAHVVGERNRDTVATMSRGIVAACVRYGRDRVLVDMREFHGQMGIFDAFSIPIALFPSIREVDFVDQVAVLDAKERAHRAEFLSSMARKSGYNFRAFDDLDRAVKWISSPDDAAALG